MRREACILTFHSVEGSGSAISIAPEEFDRQLAHLRRLGYTSLSLNDATRLLREGETLPERGLVITFDDGYRNNLTEALPILRRHGFTATVFVVTGYCGRTNAWPDQHPSIPELPVMTRAEIREIRDAGIDLGAHTHTHPRLSRIDPTEAEREMLRSKQELEDCLGEAVPLFSYPYGDYDGKVRELAARHFQATVGNRPGRLRAGVDLHALDRINACGKLFQLLPVSVRSAASFGLYLGMKRTVDRLRGLASGGSTIS